MPKSAQTPSEALALGMLAGLLRRPAGASPASSGGVPAASILAVAGASPTAADDADAQMLHFAERHAQTRGQMRAAQQEASGHGRMLAQTNAERAEVLLRRGKLQLRMDALRAGQAAAATPELGRVLRRQRAELAVEAEALDAALARHEAVLTAARTGVNEAQATHARLFEEARAAAKTLHALQERAAPLAQAFASVDDQLQIAACRLFLRAAAQKAATGPAAAPVSNDGRAAWATAVHAAASALERVHVAMNAGRYGKDAMDAHIGGRATAVGEVLSALVSLDEQTRARSLFNLACPPEQFFHQIFPVFRSYCLGMYLGGEHILLAEAVRLHRYAEGVRGALAQAYWALLQQDGPGFAAALPQLVLHDWRTWSHTQTPAMGLVSTSTCALLRLGRARGLPVPTTLGVTVPACLWQR